MLICAHNMLICVHKNDIIRLVSLKEELKAKITASNESGLCHINGETRKTDEEDHF